MRKISSFLCLCIVLILGACTKNDYRMNGTEMPYDYVKQKYTPAPKGYHPFYINYVGRHGSRNPVAPKFVNEVLSELQDAQKKDFLTPKGEELISLLERVSKESEGKWGMLTPVGEAQIRGIAQRLLLHYPEVWGEHIYAQADNVERCVKSMDVMLEEINSHLDNAPVTKEVVPVGNPTLDFFDVNLAYLKYKSKGAWRDEHKAYADSLVQNSRVIRQLFIGTYADSMQHKLSFLDALFRVYAILPNTTMNISLTDYFTGDELYTLWDIQNTRQYLEKGPTPLANELPSAISFPLLEDFMVTSYNSIVDGGVSADFRFAHAETIIPFTALLGIPEASYKTTNLNQISLNWKDFEIAPMAANLMWVFYSNDEGDILVKMLLNEKEVSFPFSFEMAPYYPWEMVRNYYQKILENLPVTPTVSTEQKVKYFKTE